MRRAAQPHFDMSVPMLRSIESRLPVPKGVVARFQKGDLDSSDSDCLHETFMNAVAKVRRPQLRMDVRVRKRHGRSQVVFGSSGAHTQPKIAPHVSSDSFATVALKRHGRDRASMRDWAEDDERAFLHIPKVDLTSKKAAAHNPLGKTLERFKSGTAAYFEDSDDCSVHTDFEFPETTLSTRRVGWDDAEASYSAADSPRVEELKKRFAALQASAYDELRKHASRNVVAKVRWWLHRERPTVSIARACASCRMQSTRLRRRRFGECVVPTVATLLWPTCRNRIRRTARNALMASAHPYTLMLSRGRFVPSALPRQARPVSRTADAIVWRLVMAVQLRGPRKPSRSQVTLGTHVQRGAESNEA